MNYVENLYGNAQQQFDDTLILSKSNANTGNLLQPLKGGKTLKRGGNLAAAIPPLSLLMMQQLYGRKSRSRGRARRFRKSRFRFKRSRKLR